MKKIDMKKALNERVRNTEWTDANTWNVLRKIRNTKAARREFSPRRLLPAAMALLLVFGIGIAALTGKPGGPDPIREKDKYTAQPIVTALSGGQGEGYGDLPEGVAEAIYEQMKSNYPEIADQMRPINLSCEKDGIRLELISGAVKGDEAWVIYSLQDVEGRYPEGIIAGYPTFDSAIGEVLSGESPALYVDEKEHKQYFCSREQYEQPVDTKDRVVAFGMSSYEAERKTTLDLMELLKEHGTTSEGILSPELEPVYTAEGEVPRESRKVLDYTKPLDIPVLDNVKLTGIGWIDGSLHIQFHNPDAHGIGDRALNNWGTSVDYDSDYWTENLFDWAYWDENGDGASNWEEEILNCTPEILEKLKPTVKVTVTDNIVDGDWRIRFPLRTICADTVDRIDPGTELLQREPEVAYSLYDFFIPWAGGDYDYMRTTVSSEWMSDVYNMNSWLRTLIASGKPLGYQVNSISGQNGDTERVVSCTVEMATPDGEEPVFRRYEIPLRYTLEMGYRVDPTGLTSWESGTYDPSMTVISLSPDTILSQLLLDYSLRIANALEPVRLNSKKQGISLDVVSGMVNGKQARYVCILTDTNNNDSFPVDPVFTDDVGTIVESHSISMFSDADRHMSYWIVEMEYDQPVALEDRTVTLKMNFVNIHEGEEADLTPMLKQYAKAVEGVEPPSLAQSILKYRHVGPTNVPGLKVLDYTKPLDIPLFGNATLGNIGWIDGKLHIQIHTDSPNLGGFSELWLNASLDGNTDTLWKELDYSPVEWYDDNGSWYEYVYDYTPEDLEKLEMTINAIYEPKTLTDDWSVSFPLSAICEGSEAAETSTIQVIREKINEMYPGVGDELITIDQTVEANGIRVKLVSALVDGKESKAVYTVQDLENKYAGLKVEPAYYYDSSSPEDSASSGILSTDKVETATMSDDALDEDAHISMHSIMCTHNQPVQNLDREITLGLKNLKFVRQTTVDMHPYIQEYAKPQEGKTTRAYGQEMKILDTDERLSIPLGRDDVLLTGIGWIDNQLHVRVEYTGEKRLQKNAISNGQDCNVWISGGYIDPEGHPEPRVDYTMLMGPANSAPWQFEEILDCRPEDVDKLDLIANIDVVEDSLAGDWSFSVSLSTICPEIEPAEVAAETDEEWRAAITSRLNEFLTFWQQKDKASMLAMCTTPWRSERSLLNQILGRRIPEVWQVTDIKGEGWPVVTVGCEIRMQSEADAGFYLVKMKKEADGLWYFEPAGLGEGNSVYSVWFDMKDEDVILSSDETGSTVKAGEIPAFVSRINEFYTCWSKGDKEGMLALCPPDMRDTGYENFMIYLQSLPGTPLEWKIGQLYGKPEDDIRGAACEGIHLEPNNRKVMNLADIVVRKESDGQWYIIPASIDEIANSYAKTANGMAPLPEDEWHTTLSGRLDEFISCWQKKDKDGLLALCTTPWRSEWDKLNQLLENRTPKSWEIKWVKESGLPVVTVGCSISIQSEDEDGFFRFTAKKGTDGLWYFEPHKIWDTKVTVDLPYSITDKDLILIGNEKGSQAKAEEIPPFVDSITDFLTLWNKGNTKGMLALCQPSMRNDERHVATVEFMVKDGYKPIEWKIGQLYGAPEEDARGAACELTIRKKNGQEILYPVDITATKEADGQWYISYMSIEQIMSDMLQTEDKAAEEEYSSRNDPAREEIINCLNEFYSCWLNNDRDGMLALCVPGEDNRGYQSVIDYMLEFGQLKGFYPGEIRETGDENTRSIHGSALLRMADGNNHLYYVNFTMERTDDGLWHVGAGAVQFTLVDVVELQEATADGQETRKRSWPITVSMDMETYRFDQPKTIDVSISVINTSGNKLIESMILFDQTMTRIDEFGTAGLEAGEMKTWSGKYTVTREQLNDGEIYFFLYYSEYNESTEEFEPHTVSFSRPITRGEAPAQETASPAPAARSGRPVRVEMELGKEKLSGPETIDVTIAVTNVSGDKLAGPVTLYDPDGNQVAEYSNEDFAADETKEWTGKWTVTEEQLADGKVGFSVKYSDYKEGTQDVMAHKLSFSKEIRKE